MSVVKSDRRQVRYRDHPEVRERAARRLRRQMREKIALARDLVVLHRDASYVAEGCSTVGHFGSRHLGDPVETAALCDVGYALEAFPDLESRLLEGAVPLRSAVFLGRLAQVEGALRPDDRWLHLAATRRVREVRREAEARIEEVKRRVPRVVEITVHVTGEESERFDRARVLASRRRGRSLTKGEAFVELVDHYLESDGLESATPAARRMGPAADHPERRTIPREVLRRIRQRSADACEYPGCTNRVFVQKAHVRRSKAAGGAQELEDLANLCTLHHTLHDAGRFHLVGWAIDFRPIFRKRGGEILWPAGALEPPPSGAGRVCDRRHPISGPPRSPRPPTPRLPVAAGSG